LSYLKVFKDEVMRARYYRLLVILISLFSVLNGFMPAAQALKLPRELKLSLNKTLPVARFRLDGAVETKNGALYLAAVPNNTGQGNKGETFLKAVFPNKGTPEFLLFDDGWCFMKVLEIDKQRTVISLDKLPSELQRAILSTKMAPDLIVPENFVLPSSLKSIAGNITVSLKASPLVHAQTPTKASSIANENKAIKVVNNTVVANKSGWILVTSPATGKISMLTYPDLVKTIEFPIQGTPSGIAFANGIVYIADQSKARILKLDPYKRIFLGQIDLPKGSVPKDVVALPDGKLIYVSENMLADVAVFETDSDKLLVRTKVHNYPGRMAIDPDGTVCIILSVPDGRASLVSTQTQCFISTLPVGSLPNGIAFDNISKMAYISNRVSNTVAVVDLVHRGVVLNLKTGSGPTGLVVDTDNKKLYIANAKDNTLSVFDTTSHKKVGEIRLPLDVDFPGSLTLLPDKKHILVSSESTDALGLFDIDTQTFAKTEAIGHTSDQCLWIPDR
jgi:YVTN family beta-propeller protein